MKSLNNHLNLAGVKGRNSLANFYQSKRFLRLLFQEGESYKMEVYNNVLITTLCANPYKSKRLAQ